MAAAAPTVVQVPKSSRLGWAWILMWVSLGIHVFDEAVTGFLSVYNPTVSALHARLGFWLMPLFSFQGWLTSLVAGIVLLALLSPFAFQNARWIRPIFYFVAVVAGILNALGHIAGTVLGHTVNSVTFPRPAPGFYSSPLLLIAAGYGIVQLRRSRMSE